MIQPQTIVRITDNSGGKSGRVFKVLGGSKKRYAELGEMVVLAVQTAEPRKAVKKKDKSNKKSTYANNNNSIWDLFNKERKDW